MIITVKHWHKHQEPPAGETSIPDHFFREVDIEFLIHELKGPIAVIEAGMRTLLEKEDKFGSLSPKQKKTIKRSLRNSVKAREMIYGLLEIGRSEADCFECVLCNPADALIEAVASALETVSGPLFDEIQGAGRGSQEILEILRSDNIRLTLSNAVIHREMFQDAVKLGQIAGNLIKNALHYRASIVEISADIQDDHLVVDISDDGPGIAPEDHKAVFERYTRVKTDDGFNRSGHGLGLAGSYILATRMGGSIAIVNRSQGGACFRLTLPVHMKRPEQTTTNQLRGDIMTGPESILKGKRILAVDDEEDILETIEDILDDADLDFAKDYDSASQKIEANKYDLVILDIMGVNGLKLLEEAVAKGIPSVMLTAHSISPESLMESIRKGAISYLPKESLTDLESLLEDLLDAHENGRPPWKLLFEKLGDYFDQRFGPNWKETEKDFWTDFDRNYQVSRGIQERLKTDRNILDKGI